MYDVPAGTAGTRCKGKTCGKIVYWITYQKDARCPRCQPSRVRRPANPECPVCHGLGKVKKDVRQPVDCSAEFGGFAPNSREPGKGISHFRSCPDVREF